MPPRAAASHRVSLLRAGAGIVGLAVVLVLLVGNGIVSSPLLPSEVGPAAAAAAAAGSPNGAARGSPPTLDNDQRADWSSAAPTATVASSAAAVEAMARGRHRQGGGVAAFAGVTSLVSATGGDVAQCLARCNRLRRQAGLCQRAVWVAHRAACVMMAGNVTLDSFGDDADGADDVVRLLRDDAPAPTDAPVVAADHFQRLPALAPPSVAAMGQPLLVFSGLPLDRCLAECVALARNASRVLLDPVASSEHRLAAGRHACRQVVWRAATEECVLRSGEPLLVPASQVTTYQLIRQPWSAPRTRPKSSGALLAGVKDEKGVASTAGVDGTAFVILAGSKLVGSRLLPALRTWLAEQTALLLVEDTPEGRVAVAAALRIGVVQVSTVPRYHNSGDADDDLAAVPSEGRTNISTSSSSSSRGGDGGAEMPLFPNPYGTRGRVGVAFLAEPAQRLVRSFNGAWKNLAALEPMASFRRSLIGQGAGVRWWMMADDDTVVIPSALRYLVESMPARRAESPGDPVWVAEANGTSQSPGQPLAPAAVGNRSAAAADDVESGSSPSDESRPTAPDFASWDTAKRGGTLVGRIFAGDAVPFNDSSRSAAEDAWGALDRRLPLFGSTRAVRALGPRYARKMPNRKPHFPFVQGGAGILFDAEAFTRMARVATACRRMCLQWAGDIRLSCCAVLANVSLPAHHTGFWSQHPATVLGHPATHRMHPFPVSFHKMRGAADVRAVWAVAEREAAAGKLVSWRALMAAVGWSAKATAKPEQQPPLTSQEGAAEATPMPSNATKDDVVVAGAVARPTDESSGKNE